MSFQTVIFAGDAYQQLRSNVAGWKAQAQNALAFMQVNSIDTNFVFRILDQLGGIIASINTFKVVAGLDAYATAQGYTGTMSADSTAIATAALTCISWVVTNFPTDTGGFLQAITLNADGSRTARSFTTTQTAGLQTNLAALIATIQ